MEQTPTRKTISRRGSPRRKPAVIAAVALVLLVLGGLGVMLWQSSQAAAQPKGRPIATLSAGDFHALAFSPTEPGVVYFGHHNGIMRSPDGGISWETLVEQRNFDVMSMLIRASVPPQIAVAGHDVFHYSWDGGETWKPFPHNLPNTDIHGLTMNFDNPNALTAYVVGEGLFATPDGGKTWNRLPAQPADANSIMALASAGGDPETLYVGTLGGQLLQSRDGGATWTSLGDDLGTVLSIAVDPQIRDTVYVGTDRGMMKTVDGGATWTTLASYPGQNAAVLAVNPIRSDHLLAISVTSEGTGFLFESLDGGRSWGGL